MANTSVCTGIISLQWKTKKHSFFTRGFHSASQKKAMDVKLISELPYRDAKTEGLSRQPDIEGINAVLPSSGYPKMSKLGGPSYNLDLIDEIET